MFRTRLVRSILAGSTLLTALVGSVVAIAAAVDERSAAESALHEVDGSPKKDVANEPASRARAALDRAARLRAAGDEAHARLADGVARRWAEVARDVTRAASAEESAANARRGATDAGVVAERERALLEEAIAQSGRLRAQLDSQARGSKEEPARTSTAANADAGATRSTPRREPARARDGGAR